MKIVITGASGFIGSTLADAFAQRGDAVLGIDRREPSRQIFTRFVQAGLSHPLEPGFFEQADLVIHAAHDLTPGALQSNVSGTQRWFRQARQEGAAAQLFLTSVSAHPDAPSEYGLVKYELENFFVQEGERVIRAGLVAGPGGVFGGIVNAMRKLPVAPVPGGNGIRVNLTDIHTLRDVILNYQVLGKGRIYDVFQPESFTLMELARTARIYFKVRGPVFSLPVGLSLALLFLGEKLLGSASLSYASFCALKKSQDYVYKSSYLELGLPSKSVQQMLEATYSRMKL